jgi:hypothetical protein
MHGSFVCAVVALSLLAPLDSRCAEPGLNFEMKSIEMSTLGDRMFREARFEEAEATYSEALDLDQKNVPAHLGMGRLASLLSQPQQAARHFSAAYQLAPRDPDAILAFANILENPGARRTLLRNFLAFSTDARVEDVKARLRIAEQLGASALPVLKSPYRIYRIPLSGIRSAGLLLGARINGGRKLRLIVDTGATGIVLNASAGAEMDLEFLADAALSGYGSATPAVARVARAASFETGDLRIENLLVHVGETSLTRDADGFIGLDVFKDFLIRVDSPARRLELTPFAAPTSGDESRACDGCMRAYRLGSLLLLRGTINGHSDGYFVLDSGSPFSMVSSKLVPQEGRRAIFRGSQGDQAVALHSAPVSIQLGSRHLMDFEYATFDSTGVSLRNGTEIVGAIGYSLLRDRILTIDYRAGTVRLSNSER